jgi:hypothetical protein
VDDGRLVFGAFIDHPPKKSDHWALLRGMVRKKLTTREYQTIQKSLKGWLGFVGITTWSTVFECSAVTVLSRLLDPNDGAIDEFLVRYRVSRRVQLRSKVKKTVLFWLAELAGEDV